jgi:predicted permease
LPRRESLDHVWAQAGVLAGQVGSARAPARDGRADVSRWVRSDLLKTSTIFVIVMSIPCLVLIIGCINAASLLLARATHRGHEIAVRLAIGASRGRVARQLLLESVLLSLAAAAAALPAAWWGLRVAEHSFGVAIPMDASVLASGLAAAVVSAVGAGLVPALRVSAHRPALALGAAHGSDFTPRQTRMRRALVAVQVAISIGLLMSGAQLVTAFEGLFEKERVDPDRLVMASFDLGQLNVRESSTLAFYRELIDRLHRLPQVEAAGLAGQTAFWNFARGNTTESLVMAWPPNKRPTTYMGGYAGGDLFRAVGLRVLQGRDFTPEDRAAARPRVAIVSRPLAEELFGPAALGQTVRVAMSRSDASAALDVRIVGIVEPSWDRSYSTKPTPALFVPVPLGHQPALTLYVRSRVPIGALAPILRDAVRQIDPRVPVINLATLRQRSDRATPEASLGRAVAVFGVVASALAAFGMYALFSYLVTMRKRELAVRMALGASASRTLRLVVRQAMTLAAIGAAVGSPAAVVVAIFINLEFHGMQGLDPMKLAGTVAMFAAVMLLASLVPAIRAARVDPISILKT